MKPTSQGSYLTAVLVDYDNIYLSLRRKNEEAAKRFSKDAGLWIREIEQGRLITPSTAALATGIERRIVINRCFGNPVPRRNAHDNSTDMSSFPFVRHHFLRAGFEVVDCPPLTAQLKNSSDIRMVMDVRDLLLHDTYFDEFVILSGDADFTPVLHRLRAHARRTVVFSGSNTAAAYTAISDGEIREADLLTLLLEGRLGQGEGEARAPVPLTPAQPSLEVLRRDIVAEVVGAVRTASQPIALEVLADRAVRALGHERTAGSAWGGVGSFRDLLATALPEPYRLSPEAPFVVIDTSRHLSAPAPTTALAPRVEPAPARSDWLPPLAAPGRTPALPEQRAEPRAEARGEVIQQPERLALSSMAPLSAPQRQAPLPAPAPAAPFAPQQPQAAHQQAPASTAPQRPASPPRQPMAQQPLAQQPLAQQPSPPPFAPAVPQSQPAPTTTAPRLREPAEPARQSRPVARQAEGTGAAAIQQSIARIHDACQAPPFSPAEYRALFEAMSGEINERGLLGAQTLTNIAERAAQTGIEIKREDVRFLLEVVSEADPWFEQGASANLFAGRFRNFVVARCRGQGLNLSVDELDLIDAWFVGNPGQLPAGGRARPGYTQQPAASQPTAQSGYAGERRYGEPTGNGADAAPQPYGEPAGGNGSGGYGAEVRYQAQPAAYDAPDGDGAGEEFPRIVRTRLRG